MKLKIKVINILMNSTILSNRLKKQKNQGHWTCEIIQPLLLWTKLGYCIMKTYFEKLKYKWKINSNFQLLLIFIVFTLAGYSVVTFRKLFFMLVGIENDTAFWIKTVTYILFIFPAYQLLLLVYGFLLGQFSFFWEKEKKLLNAILKQIK